MTPPRLGEYLSDELDARGWTQTVFAEVLGRPLQYVSEIITGKKEVTRQSAAQVAAALGTSAELWLARQHRYMLARLAEDSRVMAKLEEVRLRSWLRENV